MFSKYCELQPKWCVNVVLVDNTVCVHNLSKFKDVSGKLCKTTLQDSGHQYIYVKD